MLHQIAHPTTQIMKVADEGDGTIVAFAKWSLHGSKLEHQSTGHVGGAVQPSNKPSPDMNLDACGMLAAAQFKMHKDMMGERGHYCGSHANGVYMVFTFFDPHSLCLC